MRCLGKIVLRLALLAVFLVGGLLALRWLLAESGPGRPWVCNHTPVFHHALCEEL